MQQRADFSNHHFRKLNHYRDYKDKGNGFEKFQTQGNQKVLISQVAADVPAPFRGAAIGMISAGLMSLAFMGFTGLIKL